MNPLLLTIFLFLSFSLHNFPRIERNKFNEIELGKTLVKEVKQLYPNTSTKKVKRKINWQTKQYGRISSPIVVMNSISLKEEGIIFIYDLSSPNFPEDSRPLSIIEFEKPFKGRTDKGIGINSTLSEVIAAYGPDPYGNSEGDFLDYFWIEFRFDKRAKVKNIRLTYDKVL